MLVLEFEFRNSDSPGYRMGPGVRALELPPFFFVSPALDSAPRLGEPNWQREPFLGFFASSLTPMQCFRAYLAISGMK